MKALHVTTHFNVGGISNYIMTLSTQLKRDGVDVLVASSGGDLEPELQLRGIRHYPLDIRTKFEFGPKVLSSAFRLSALVKSEAVTVIHAHTRVCQVAALLASKMSGVPLVTTCHGYFKKRMRAIVDAWGSSVIAISDAVRSHLVDDLGVDAGRVELIYSGVDSARFCDNNASGRQKELKKDLGLTEGPVIGTIGRLSSIKGQKYFIEAMKEIISQRPDAQAILLGSGDEEAALKHQAKSLGIAGAVRFFDSCPDTYRFLSAMDVFVFPSIKEGLGIALLEALASQRACVASRIGGIENIIEDGYNGLLVEVGDAHAIAEAVLRLLNDQTLLRAMGQRGRELVRQKFTLEGMSQKVLRLYEKVAG